MTVNAILVIGAGGGIGKALVSYFANFYPSATVYAVSRSHLDFSQANVIHATLNTDVDTDVLTWLKSLKDVQFDVVIGAMGLLHGEYNGTPVKPEKKLEDINTTQMQAYFHINTIVPSIWIKHLVKYMNTQKSIVCFLSARVGSIADNRMGGWYGYRASKAALNMIMKTANIEYRRRTRHTAFVSYHPGTVDSNLSKPFQANVKPEKLFTAEYTAARLCTILTEINVEEGPYFLDWDDKPVSW